MDFKLVSTYLPTGDQPEALRLLTQGVLSGLPYQTLLGVTGSGKTFTIANVIANVQRPTLVLIHNKTLAAQLYSEFKEFFPENAVEYFVSYYDYYQPEAYLPITDTYIEKDLSINDEIEKLRLSATSSLLSGRRDVIVVATVSCIYGIGNPDDFHANTIHVIVGDKMNRDALLRRLVDALYFRSDKEFTRGSFRVKGDTVDVFLAYNELALRIIFFDDEIEDLYYFDPNNGVKQEKLNEVKIFPANIFVTTKERIFEAIKRIQDDMMSRIDFFQKESKFLEASRIKERTLYDIEMIKELGHCRGIENYSRYFDGRPPGVRPFCLLDFFPSDYLTIIDESHVTVPQIGAMYGGDRARKINLIDYGFRLPAAADNRPLTYNEFEQLAKQTIYVSATPNDFEIQKSEGVIVEQFIRPTGLLDPIIEIRSSKNQVDDLILEISKRTEINERVLVTTLTKRMAEELTKYLQHFNIKTAYIHSDVETLDRVQILSQLREGIFDVLVGVNLLREGLDLPEVSLVAIIDADKEGFLRSEKSLTQTAGRAARHINGKVIMYADIITKSMQKTIDETNRRREKQLKYNIDNNITPTQIFKTAKDSLVNRNNKEYYIEPNYQAVADPVVEYMSVEEIKKSIKNLKKQMFEASDKLDFVEAARLRDEMYMYEKVYIAKTK